MRLVSAPSFTVFNQYHSETACPRCLLQTIPYIWATTKLAKWNKQTSTHVDEIQLRKMARLLPYDGRSRVLVAVSDSGQVKETRRECCVDLPAGCLSGVQFSLLENLAMVEQGLHSHRMNQVEQEIKGRQVWWCFELSQPQRIISALFEESRSYDKRNILTENPND